MNLAASLLYAAERDPGREALVHDGLRLTYRDLHARATHVAGGLAREGVGRGARVAVLLRNGHEAIELYWACQWLGAAFVPINWRLSDSDIDYCIGDCAPKLVLREGFDFERLLAAEAHPGALDLPEDAESLMLYTSGTTGRPKGVPRSHSADRAGGLSQALQHGYRFGDRTLLVMPLYHTMGMHSVIATSLIGGCCVVQAQWDAERALELIERERITSLYLAPTLFHDLAWHPRRGDFDLRSVETLAYAGAAMTSALVERCVEVFGPRVFVNHYGSTEIYTFSIDRDQATKPGCAGHASLNARLRLGEQDEILCHMSSDEAFAGYWNRPDANEKAIRDGWYRTGDIGRLDEDGDLWIAGRVDDMIVSGGENIHPLEVEDVVAQHPHVREVAVVGAPDDRWGHRVVAYVVTDGEVTVEELDNHCLASGSLARFKRPREYRIVDELPKSPSGKILRRMLREEVSTR